MTPTPNPVHDVPHQENSNPNSQRPSESDDGYTNCAFESDQYQSKQGNVFSEVQLTALNVANEKFNNNNSTTTAKENFANLDFDDILPHIGEFGRYQKILFFLMIPFAFSVAFTYFTQIFITLVPEKHWCRIPELGHLTRDQRLALGIPVDKSTITGFSRCLQFDVNFTEILSHGITESDPSWKAVRCKNGWEFDQVEIPYSTISTELEWVCDNSALPSIAQSIFFCGAIVGGLLFGWIADRYGRIPSLVISNLFGLVGGIATAFSTNFWMFSVCRFIVGFAFDNCFTMMYILVLEYVGPKWRTFVANMSIAIFFTFAACVLPWIALWLRSWQWLTIVTSIPLALAIFAPWLVPESARWLVSQGQTTKAIEILHKFEKINKKKLDAEIFTEFRRTCDQMAKEEQANSNYSIFDLFKTPRLRNITILFIIIWMAISITFDGHVRNVGALGLDVFVTFTIAAATEMPADVLLTFTLDRFGRRWYAFVSMVLSGVFSLLATLFPVGFYSALMAICGRFWVNISYNIGLQYVAEVLPTVVRAQGVTFVHIMGYVASIAAPFIVYLGNISPTLPLLILGVTGIFGGVLSLFLPETMDQDLPQSLLDGEEFGRDQSFFDFPCCSRKNDDENEESRIERFTRTGSRGASLRASSRAEFGSNMLHRSFRRRNQQNQ